MLLTLLVRKHRAPNGALRRWRRRRTPARAGRRQKAPSAKRCIKTRQARVYPCPAWQRVRKHRAPKGALRLSSREAARTAPPGSVTKHRAPKGALRQVPFAHSRINVILGHKAPSAKRCIKTHLLAVRLLSRRLLVTKHRAPKGALRHCVCVATELVPCPESQSTERQKVH